MKTKTLLWSADGPPATFQRTTIRALGHDEAFLEARIAEHPDILGLESLESGIRGPFRAFTQVPLLTPTGRIVYPDVVLITRSAHLVAVEVKLEDNPELVSRAVIAQVVDYAASLSALDEESLASLLSGGDETSLAALAADWFPDCPDATEFAEVLAGRCARGDVDLVVACDRVPAGFEDLGAALDQQSALAFKLQVIELAPWVSTGAPDRILFLNRERIRTEIVARTQVTVSWEGGATEPQVTVQTTSPEDVEEAMETARGKRPPTHDWTHEEIRASLEDPEMTPPENRDTLLWLLELAVRESHEGRITNQKTVHPSFGQRLAGRDAQGKAITRQIWSAAGYDKYVWISLSSLDALLPEELHVEARERFANLLGEPRPIKPNWITLPLADLAGHLEAFETATRWVQERVRPPA